MSSRCRSLEAVREGADPGQERPWAGGTLGGPPVSTGNRGREGGRRWLCSTGRGGARWGRGVSEQKLQVPAWRLGEFRAHIEVREVTKTQLFIKSKHDLRIWKTLCTPPRTKKGCLREEPGAGGCSGLSRHPGSMASLKGRAEGGLSDQAARVLYLWRHGGCRS